MTPEEITTRMAELAHRASRLAPQDPALAALLEELQALASLVPSRADSAGPEDEDSDIFENMPV